MLHLLCYRCCIYLVRMKTKDVADVDVSYVAFLLLFGVLHVTYVNVADVI